ncbi:protein kinase-like protein [Amycolatopsis sulphurea]|uniref:non-specific serine/threonine protein kinase n=1 Tax=Amycolatopsis sulphurea TaxID=76022 RepID=A0A2A9FBM5_9PSEU|nr:class III lanthionine synthetase LanKC [Amycolatopsis sulphurea]PFG47952.1 protein kinase-like protein [Amycolatopsis sulphurea]
MDVRYEAFCFADPLFYDEPRQTAGSLDDLAAELPEPGPMWTIGGLGIWRSLRPKGQTLPSQGWKIHVSAGLDNAAAVLAKVHRYCLEHRVAYKHLRSRSILLTRNSKYAPREGSGKLITIYPDDEQALSRILNELSAELAGEHGAYILSDLRYREGPLYVRYGGFALRWTEHAGARVPAIRRPDGSLVPDKREPTFSVPDWVHIPSCLSESVAARRNDIRFPYQVTGSLHFSNGGGVYLAERDGQTVVLKEARPYAGLDREGVDAVTRLRHEHEILDRLAGVTGVPRVYERFLVWEHHYLAMQQMPGQTLGNWLAEHYPLTHGSPSEADLLTYRERALHVLAQVESILAEIHRRGIVFGDLHGRNILVDDQDVVSLIDFELAADVDSARRPRLGAPGFRAPAGKHGFEIDEHALAALRLWLFLPLVMLLELAPGKLRGAAEFATQRFHLPEGYAENVVSVLAPRTDPPAVTHTALDEPQPDWALVRKQIVEGVLTSATPDRTDRLFPGDIEQFRSGGAGFGVGAAGVLHSLHVAGAGRYPEHEQWLLDAVRREPLTRPGFFDGTHGIAYVLEEFGYPDEVDRLLAESQTLVEQTTDHGLETGLAGIGLTRLHLATTRGDNEFGRQALDIAVRLADVLDTAAPPGKHARAGLLGGWSGPALLFLRLYERTGEEAWLAFAEQALDRDLEECISMEDGSLQVRDGTLRVLPYAGVGSAGILMVAEQLARHRPESKVCQSLPGLRAACTGEFVIYPGLLYGRCGLAAALSFAAEPDRKAREAIDLHLARLSWHAVPFRGGLAFPGNQLLRLSTDVTTGSAGVLRTLAALLDGTELLPFLGTAPSTHTSGR